MLKNNYSIAILLAVYNGEKYLAEQIDSLLVQTNQDWTLYIRNDASTDGTEQIIDKYCKEYPGKVIEIDKGGPNLGCSGNFFRLLEAVQSEYYMFCDQDDIWLPRKIEISLKEIERFEADNPGKAILVHVDCAVCDENLNIIMPSYWTGAGINPDNYSTYNYIAVSCVVAGAKSIFNNPAKNLVMPWVDNGLIYDYWLALNVAKYGIIKAIREPLTLYRQHNSQVCGLTVGGKDVSGGNSMSPMRRLKEWRHEAGLLKRAGYGPRVKYYWYKILARIKN